MFNERSQGATKGNIASVAEVTKGIEGRISREIAENVHEDDSNAMQWL